MRMLKKPLFLLALDLAAILPAVFVPSIRYALWPLVVPTVLLIVLVVTLLWPSGGVRGYFSYRTPLVIAAMSAELWLIVGGLTLQLPANRIFSVGLFQGFLVIFFLLTTLNSLPWMTGKYRAGAGLRPDLIFGGGAYLVRGEIFVALGIEFLISPEQVAHPVFNWWAVASEVAALLILVAYRGVLKMQMRRARFLGADDWKGAGLRAGVWLREISLYLALLFVVYAFFNMYAGLVPFTWVPGDPRGIGSTPIWSGFIWLGVAFVLLVPLRGWLKTRLPEPPTLRQELAKELLLWVGYLPLIYGFLLIFSGQIHPLRCCGYYNFWWGIWVSLLGFLMIVPLRVITLREEFRGTVKVMTGDITDYLDEQRRELLGRRLRMVAALGERERTIHLGLMMSGINDLPPKQQQAIQRARQAILEQAPSVMRERLQRTSAQVMASADDAGPEQAARAAMT